MDDEDTKERIAACCGSRTHSDFRWLFYGVKLLLNIYLGVIKLILNGFHLVKCGSEREAFMEE